MIGTGRPEWLPAWVIPVALVALSGVSGYVGAMTSVTARLATLEQRLTEAMAALDKRLATDASMLERRFMGLEQALHEQVKLSRESERMLLERSYDNSERITRIEERLGRGPPERR